jgi:DNA-binding CsgD family transcriptional regulator
MQVDFLNLSDAASDGNERFETLIAAMGKPFFDDAVCSYASREFRCGHVTAFAYGGGRRSPRILLASDRSEPALARRTASKYIQDYWHLDPANQISRSEPRVGAGAMLRLRYEEIDNEAYRRDCYNQIHLVDRFSLVRSQGTELIRLNIYRDVNKGRFGESDLWRLAAACGLLMQIILKHDESRPSVSDGERVDVYRSRLRSFVPHLSEREMEICTEIVLGHTSEAIASKLGVSINTILTHRKRAYAKLAISSQNELSRIVLQ